MLILFLVLFFLLQALVLFCCLAAGNDAAVPENFRSGTDGLYQTVDGEAFRVMNIKNRGYNSHL